MSLLATWVVSIAMSASILGALDLFADGGGRLEAAWLAVQHTVESSGVVDVLFVTFELLIINWANMALVATVFLTGRNGLVVFLCVVPYVFGVLFLIFHKTIGLDMLATLFTAGSWGFSFGALALTIAAFILARRRGLIDGRLQAVAFGLWLTAGVAFAWRGADRVSTIIESGVGMERALLVIGPGLLALAVAPLALAPLAVAWNRHR